MFDFIQRLKFDTFWTQQEMSTQVVSMLYLTVLYLINILHYSRVLKRSY